MHRTVAARLAKLPALATLFLLCLTTLAAHAQGTTRNVPGSYPTIQAAIVAAGTGDTVVVAPGTYYENIDFLGKAITVTSDTANGGSPANTIIDGGGGNLPTVQFVTDEGRNSILLNLTIRNGGAFPSGTGPAANPAGGGVWINGASPVLAGNVITANKCYGVQSINGGPLLQENEISGTTFTPGLGCSAHAGSGVWIFGGSTGANGALTPILNRNTIENNLQSGLSTAPASGDNGGGAIAIDGVIGAVIVDNTLRNNTTAAVGGAISVTNTDSFFIFNNLIVGNQAESGAAIFVQIPGISLGIPNAVISNNTIANNTDNPSGADLGQLNDAQVLLAGGLSRLVFANNILAGVSSATTTLSCQGAGSSPVPPSLESNDLFQRGSFSLRGDPGCVAQAVKFGNSSVDPQFNNPAGGDFHLRQGSPVIEAGNTSALTDLFANDINTFPDLDGNPRVVDATGLAYPVIDLGAYEAQGSIDAIINALFLTASQYEIPGGSSANLNAALFTSSTGASGTVTLAQNNPDGTSQSYTAPLVTRPPAPPTNPGGIDASFATTPLAPGLYSFVATYAGTSGASPATAVHAYILVDNYATALTLTSSLNPSTVGQSVTFTVTLSSSNGVPPGAVALSIDGSPVTSLQPDPTSGVATYTTSSLAVGTHPVNATYAGTATYNSATANLSQTVNAVNGLPTTTAVFAQPSTTVGVGQPVTFSVQVTNNAGPTAPIPAGTANLLDGSQIIGTQTLGITGFATFPPISTLTVGTHTITANYVPASGTPAFAPSSAFLTETITAANTTTVLAANPNPASALTTVSLLATVAATGTTATPTGTVIFYDGGTVLGSAPVDPIGNATLSTSTLAVGTHALHAVYSGNGTLSSSTSTTVNEVINAISSTTTILATPTSATAFSPIRLTSHTASGSSTPVNAPACGGQCVPLVTFVANGAALGTSPIDINGNASITITPPAGTYSISATFSGSGIFSNSTSTPPVIVTVTALGSSLALVGNPATVVARQPVLLTATLAATGAPASALSGPVTFSDGQTVLGTTALASGVATLTFAPTTPGAHLISAVFPGNASLGPSSATFTVNVSPRDFTITTASPSLTIKTEHHAPIQVQVATEGGLVDTIALSCSNLPQWATCTFSPGALSINQTATPADTTNSTASLVIDTDFVLGYAQLRPPPKPFSRILAPIAVALLLPGLALFKHRRKRMPQLLLAALVSVAVLSAAGCSGLYPPHTAPGTYTINVTGLAQNNNITHSTQLTLIVTP